VIVLLLKLSFLCTDERYERLHPRGHLCRVHVLAERLQGMHDAAHIAAGGKEGSQSQVHAWFVFDRDYCGPATISDTGAPKSGLVTPFSSSMKLSYPVVRCRLNRLKKSASTTSRLPPIALNLNA